MAQRVHPPSSVPGPISCDHAVVRSRDMRRMYDFMTGVVGLKESARIEAPDVGDVIAFLRGKILFHCFAYARSAYAGLHHFQMTLKNPLALYAAYDAMRAKGVEMVWGTRCPDIRLVC
ncbi:MAG: VOC family protein [Streptosporangiales bacterium]